MDCGTLQWGLDQGAVTKHTVPATRDKDRLEKASSARQVCGLTKQVGAGVPLASYKVFRGFWISESQIRDDEGVLYCEYH